MYVEVSVVVTGGVYGDGPLAIRVDWGDMEKHSSIEV